MKNLTSKRLIAQIGFTIGAGLLLVTCAKNLPPPGGPEDKSPPAMLSSVPSQNQTRVGALREAIITFSEPITDRQIEQQIFLTPRPRVPLEVKVDGEFLRVKFPDTLRFGQTYVLTIGSGVTDRRGNRLVESKAIAFTREQEIDTGYIRGYVTENDEGKNGVGVALFRNFIPAELGDMDSLYPDYFTVSGDGGVFELAFLSPGDYFLLAFQDQGNNQLFRYGVEPFGLTTHPIRVGNVNNDNLELRMRSVDTSVAQIRSVIHTTDHLVRVSLSREISPEVIAANMDAIQLQLNTDAVSFKALAVAEPSGPPRNKFDLYFEGVTSGEYSLSIDFSRFWKDGRINDIAVFTPFVVSESVDETAPEIVESNAPRKLMGWESVDWHLRFTEPIVIDTATDKITLTYSNGAQAPLALAIPNVFSLSARLNESALDGERYTLNIPGSVISDMSGNRMQDTTFRFERAVWSADSTGELSYSVENRFDPEFSGQFLIRFYRLEGGEYSAIVPDPDSSMITLPSGSYIAEVRADYPELGVDSLMFDGTLYPLQYAEPRSFLADTLRVRPRFAVAGAKIVVE